MRKIDIHPIRFGHEIPCGILDGSYRQMIQCGDETQFQIEIDICPSELNLIANGDFSESLPAPWTTGGGASWTYNSVAGYYEKQPTGVGYLEQSFNVADGLLVKLVFSVNIIDGEMTVIAGSNPATFYSETFTESGTYERLILIDSFSQLIFYGFAVEDNWQISDVSMYAYNKNYAVRVVDFYSGDIIREMNPDTDPSYFNFERSFMTFTYDWTDEEGGCLPESCYFFEISSPCDCANGGFVAEDLITVQNQFDGDVGDFSFGTSGIMVFSGAATSTLEVENLVCDDETYEVKYELIAMAPGNEFRVRVGGTSGPLRTSNGVYSDTIVASGPALTSLRLEFTNGGGGAIQFRNFSIRKIPRTYQLKSNLFRLYETAPCSSVIRACCDNDALQSGYLNTGFAPRIRLANQSGQGGYELEFKDFESSRGEKSNYYFRGRKKPNFIFNAAEYVHDFIAYLKGYDHVYIDDVEVFIENEDYNPSYIDNFDFGKGELMLSNKTELSEKRKPNNQINSCAPDGSGDELLVDGGVYDGDVIIIDDGGPLLTG